VKTVIAFPGQHLPDAYFDVRYEVLRKPLGTPRGSERLAGDFEAINVWMEDENKVVAVGRAHRIADLEDGSAFDAKAQSACPPFEPLCSDYVPIKDDNGTTIPPNLRPAIQVRGMGTLADYRGQRLASSVLTALEKESVQLWNARSGWLQARLSAIPFYIQNGWTCFGPEYDVPNVGPHRSMWKNFSS
jgi:hypothetical protein